MKDILLNKIELIYNLDNNYIKNILLDTIDYIADQSILCSESNTETFSEILNTNEDTV